jgi:hypothetical protein
MEPFQMWKMRTARTRHRGTGCRKAEALGVPVWAEDDLDRAIGGVS